MKENRVRFYIAYRICCIENRVEIFHLHNLFKVNYASSILYKYSNNLRRPHPYHILITSLSRSYRLHPYHMLTSSLSRSSRLHPYHMLTTSLSHPYHMLTTSLSHPFHMLTTSLSHPYHMLTTSLSHRYHMLTTSLSHPHHILITSLLRSSKLYYYHIVITKLQAACWVGNIGISNFYFNESDVRASMEYNAYHPLDTS